MLMMEELITHIIYFEEESALKSFITYYEKYLINFNFSEILELKEN